MRNLTLRPGETFVIGDTAVTAACPQRESRHADLATDPISSGQLAARSNPIQHQSHQRWLAAYEREECQLATSRVRIGAGDI